MRSSALCVANLAAAVLLCPISALAWGTDGHKIVAVIAADNLTPAAASHVAAILAVPADKRSIATAMEAASIRPDRSSAMRIVGPNPGTSSTCVCKTGEQTFPRDAAMETASPVKSTNTRNASRTGATTAGALLEIWRS